MRGKDREGLGERREKDGERARNSERERDSDFEENHHGIAFCRQRERRDGERGSAKEVERRVNGTTHVDHAKLACGTD